MNESVKHNKYNLFLVFFLFVFLIVGCTAPSSTPSNSQSQNLQPDFKYSVWVRDRDDNKFIGQAKVYLAVGNQTIEQEVTDDSGQASFNVNGAYMGKDARFYAEQRNYYPNDITIKLGNENRTVILMTNRSVPKIDPDPPKPVPVDKQKNDSQPPVKSNIENISIGGEKSGIINDKQTKDFQFNADKNNPVLFTARCDTDVEQTYEYYVQIFNSQGKGLKEIFLRCGNDTKELPFTPPDTGSYILRVKGDRFYGNYYLYFKSNN